jgi:HD-GYP domain-containing protein (c-di-GMP phosphodiesterase class II)
LIEIYRNDLIYSISYALDFVEHDLVMIAPHHSRRVALLSAILGRTMGYDTEQLLNLAVCGALHDNALTEYQQIRAAEGKAATPEHFSDDLGLHCTIGEKNISRLSFYPQVQGAILFHHENADGSGPFGKTAGQTPVFSRLIHIADTVDAQFDLSSMTEEKFERVQNFVRANTGILYDREVAGAFVRSFSSPERMALDADTLDRRLRSEIPEVKAAYAPEDMIRLADFFAKIIDYKSRFTFRHSRGVAQKAAQMARYYGWDENTQAQLYLAGALHDVGKLMVRSEVLEKPGQLTSAELAEVREHAYGSYQVLHGIRGLEEVSCWAYDHHEKLNGKGYPFGKIAAELGEKQRLVACLDIYQALREDRPYRAGMQHARAMRILQDMALDGQIDSGIAADIDRCFGAETDRLAS